MNLNLYKELRENNVYCGIEEVVKQYQELFAALRDEDQETLIRNFDGIYLKVQYIYNEYMKSADKLCAIDSKLDEGENIIEYREL